MGDSTFNDDNESVGNSASRLRKERLRFDLKMLTEQDVREHFLSLVASGIKFYRTAMELSRDQLAAHLEVNTSTVRKWELGISKCCREKHVKKLYHLLRGDYDEALHEKYVAKPKFDLKIRRRQRGLYHLLNLCEEMHTELKKKNRNDLLVALRAELNKCYRKIQRLNNKAMSTSSSERQPVSR